MKARSKREDGKSEQLPAREKALRAQTALTDKRALDPVMLDMRQITLITDYFLICHGTSSVHIRALGDSVVEALKEAGVRPYGVEGRDEGRWVLLDYGDVIVHIFGEEEREFYSLERLWGDAPKVADSAPHAI
ncbi:MAG: ribosome silencing factor [Armatimonadota bacterium]|nr:ribosome silencing factor [Armatimonadota bacterium]